MASPRARFTSLDLADVVVPAAPVVWGERVVYAAQRTDVTTNESFSALWAVARAGGPARRLTQGNHKDRMPRAANSGAFLLFVSDRTGSEQIHRLDAAGGEARRLTSLPAASVLDVVIAPDGACFAMLLSPAPPADDALPLAADLVREAAPDDAPATLAGAGARAGVTEAQDRRKAPRARVTVRLRNREDGRGWLGGRAHVWIVDAESGEARRLTRGALDFSFPTWTPSGEAIVACVSQPPDDVFDCDGTRNDLVAIDVASGDMRRIPKPEGAALVPSVSPDGEHVAYVLWQPGDDFGHDNAVAWVSPLGPGEPRALTDGLDRPVLDVVTDDVCGIGSLRPDRPLWSEDGRHVTLVVSDRGAVRLWDQPADGGPGRYRTDDAHAIACTADLGNGEIAALVCSRGTFPEIGAIDSAGRLRVLAAPSAELVERCAPRAPERVELERDGARIAAYYHAPRGLPAGARAPGLLYIHGGPCVAYGERLFFEMQWLADLGYAVLCTNPRGSQSYGRAYTSAIKAKWGEPDRGDQLAFADWLAARPEVDPARLAVAGGSYGGYMTLLLCATTDRFRAAIAERGLYNWASLVGASDFGHTHARIFGGKWPWEEPHRFLEASPMRLVSKVTTPMLVVHQEGDLRVGTEQAFQLFSALKLQGTPAALLLFPEEDHGMTRGGRIDRRLERLRQIEAWLGSWLRADDAAR